MKMDEMNEYLERNGFKVRRQYDGPNEEYIFDIEKRGWHTRSRFKYTGVISQKTFLNQIIRNWEDSYSLASPYRSYVKHDIDSVAKLGSFRIIPEIENVIFNGPATIVFWSDGTKTVVKCCEDDEYDPEKGIAIAISKKAMGDCKDIKKWSKKYYEDDFEEFKRIMVPALEALHNLAEKFRGLNGCSDV